MKQCPNCRAFLPPDETSCPHCADAPQAWVRTKTRKSARGEKPALPKAEQPKFHREEFAAKPVPKRSADETLQISREQVLAALRSSVDETVEGLALDPYEFEDDTAVAPPLTVDFVQFDSLEHLSEELFLTAPDSDANILPEPALDANDSIELIEIYDEELEAQAAERGAVFEEWVLDEVDALLEAQPEPTDEVRITRQASRITVWLTTICLLAVAGWAVAVEAPLPIVFALIIGACVVVMLSQRSS